MSDASNIKTSARVLRYGISGVASTLAHLGTMSLLTYVFQIQSTVASSIGFSLSVVVSYSLQRFWVFSDAASDYKSGFKFLAVTSMAFCLNLAVMWIGTELLHIEPIVPQAVAVAIIPVFNFLVNRAWTFKKS